MFCTSVLSRRCCTSLRNAAASSSTCVPSSISVVTIGTMTDRESWRPTPPVDPTGIEAPHDVLAADEFGIGTSDRRLPPDPHRFEPPHDILAAEEFGTATGDGPRPRDPPRFDPPHDIRAAEEFAMPAAGQRREVDIPPASERRNLTPLLLIAAAAALLLLRRRRS